VTMVSQFCVSGSDMLYLHWTSPGAGIVLTRE
jgi:hypothetical protein